MSKNFLKSGQTELAVKVTGLESPWVFTFSGANTAQDMLWTLKSQMFVWGGGNMQLTFQSLQTLISELGTGPAIDDISLSRRDEEIPEPGTLWSLLTGAGLLGLAVKLRRK
jgi:hypothetical protein